MIWYKCDYCGKKFLMETYRLKQRKRRFCSKECANKAQVKQGEKMEGEMLMPIESVKALFEQMVRTACQEYYKVCLPKRYARPKAYTTLTKDGKKVKMSREYTDEEYAIYLRDRETDRQAQLKELKEFFHSDLFRAICPSIDPDLFLMGIEQKRREGVLLFQCEDDT